MQVRDSLLFAPLVLFAAASVAAQDPDETHHHAPMIGSVDFRNSGNKAAQVPLQQGVAWLHNFKYNEAADAFRAAERADQSLAVAYWLEALSYSHVMWSVEYLEQSRTALARLAPTPQLRLAKAKTPRERAFGAAVEAFYANAPLSVRAKAYSDSLQTLVAQDTTDLEMAAFASHGAMMAWTSAPPEERSKLAALSRGLALRVYNANPNHPGAAHYLTHAADMDPSAAAELLPFARAYDKIAPDADHALHMPSHVYLPVGLWREVSSANERAWAATRAEVKRERAPLSSLSWHSLEWLQYAYLQEGRWSAARAIVDTARTLLNGATIAPGNADARFAVSVLAFAYGRESGDWSAWPASAPSVSAVFALPTPSMRAWQMTMTNAYQTAVAAISKSGDKAQAQTTAKRFREIADTLAPGPSQRGARRLADQLDALVARADGDLPRAITILKTSAQTEQQLASTPPTSIPTHELLGDVLLQANQPRDAAAAYRSALNARPNRSRALLGLARSLTAAGDRAAADSAYERLRDNWRRADARVLQLIGNGGR